MGEHVDIEILKLLKKKKRNQTDIQYLWARTLSIVESTVPTVINRLSSIIKIQPGFITGKKANSLIIWREKENVIREKKIKLSETIFTIWI